MQNSEMNDQIRHDGKIERILDETHIEVRIVQSSACSSCKIASHCSSSESKVKIVDVWTKDAQKYTVGQDVVVIAATKTGMTAVLIGFVLPVILVFAAVILVLNILPSGSPEAEMNNQAYAALSGLAILIPYYIGLYFFRGVMKEKFAFSIE